MLTRRVLTTTRRAMSTDAAASALPVQPTRVVYRKSRTGTFVGGVIGFLAGLTAAGSSGFLYLVDGQQQQAQALVASVDNVERHVAKVESHLSRVDALAKQLTELQTTAALKTELGMDTAAVEQLELKTRVWELQQDVLALKEVKPSPPKEGPPATPAPIASMTLVAVDKTPTSSAASTSKPVASAPATKTQPPKMS